MASPLHEFASARKNFAEGIAGDGIAFYADPSAPTPIGTAYHRHAGDETQAQDIGDAMLATLAKRQVPGEVLAQLQSRLPETGNGRKRGEKRRPPRPSKEKR